MDGQIEDRPCSVQDVSQYLGAPGVHDLRLAPRGNWPARPPHRKRVAPDVSRDMKPLGLGEQGRISIMREGAACMAYAATAITPDEVVG